MIRDARPEDAAAIAEIYNDAVDNLTAIWTEKRTDAAERAAWIAERQAAGFPVLVSDEEGRVLGYASYGKFRDKDGYDLTVEHSVYIHRDARGRGLGTPMLQALIDHARAAGFHAMLGVIAAENQGSIRLHERLGFTRVGTLPQVGKKFGRWLDLALLQITLDDRAHP
ncbi:GNAT family N-acetyltransferase [Thioclava atlantica]|uniref:N-acetyltransferase GCN5 n=1 Tax=Thioclava atlantica TaxID=1317124 RepID=A0A085TTF1_9RHOB|nr:GNAT family N-acetyltransferase [Thioclava atlantica]KFE33998.1 N-acetyltransferase GCN5 [Thioclava atlantica]